MFIVIVCSSVCDVINFEIYLSFLIQAVFLHDQKIQGKNLNILRAKRTFQMKQKALLIIFKGLSLKLTKPTFLKVKVF